MLLHHRLKLPQMLLGHDLSGRIGQQKLNCFTLDRKNSILKQRCHERIFMP